MKVHYEAGQPPWVASRLQDFFGMRDTPRIAGSAVPLVIRLCAIASGFAAFLLVRRSVLAGVAAGEVVLMSGALIYAAWQ